MKPTCKFTGYLIALLAVIWLFPSNTNAQCPTPPDYPGYPLVAGTPLTYTLCPGCVITVQWCWRYVPNPPAPAPGYNDFSIGNITMSGTCIGCAPSLDSIINIATRDIIVNQNPWNAVIPWCPTQSTNWRVSLGGCRTDWIYDPINNYFVSYTCGSVQCWTNNAYCWELIDGKQRLVVTILGRYPAGNCSTISVPGSTNPVHCYPHCD